LLVVLIVIHYAQDIDDASSIVNSTDQPEAIIADIKHDAIADLIGDPKRLPELPEVGPLSAPGCLVPYAQVSFSNCGVVPATLPEFAQPSPRDDPQDASRSCQRFRQHNRKMR
jgi:hypothetical protein